MKQKKTATNKCHNPNVLNNIFLNLVLTLNYSFKLDCVKKKNGLMMLSKTKKGTNLKKIDLSHSVNPIDLFSNQMLEFLTHFVENMP